jgi:hypothetical protein
MGARAMISEDIIRLAREACSPDAPFSQYVGGVDCGMLMRDEHLERFAALVAAAEREACAKVCEEKTAYQMQIPCPDGIPGCLVFHAIEAKREKTGSECAAAIRARGESK